MEHPDDPYHVRPFPQQPHRGGKELVATLDDLETALSDKVPNFAKLKTLQERIHTTTNTFNDDQLVDMIRQLSKGIDSLSKEPKREALEALIKQLLKIKIALKHL